LPAGYGRGWDMKCTHGMGERAQFCAADPGEEDTCPICLRAKVERLERERATIEHDMLLRVIAWLRESQRLTLAQGKSRTATTIQDLADALEKMRPAVSTQPAERGEGT
jgi:hypothetical protein